MKAIDSPHVQSVLEFVKEFSGIGLVIDGYFDNLEEKCGKRWFSIELEERLSPDNKTMVALMRMSGENSLIKNVEQNGISRLAIHI